MGFASVGVLLIRTVLGPGSGQLLKGLAMPRRSFSTSKDKGFENYPQISFEIVPRPERLPTLWLTGAFPFSSAFAFAQFPLGVDTRGL